MESATEKDIHDLLVHPLSLKESHLHIVNRWLSNLNASNNKEFAVSQGKFFNLPAILVLVLSLRAIPNKSTLYLIMYCQRGNGSGMPRPNGDYILCLLSHFQLEVTVEFGV